MTVRVHYLTLTVSPVCSLLTNPTDLEFISLLRLSPTGVIPLCYNLTGRQINGHESEIAILTALLIINKSALASTQPATHTGTQPRGAHFPDIFALSLTLSWFFVSSSGGVQ